jgi:hypothetical protein
MNRIVSELTPNHEGYCECANFLAPVTTWKEIIQRHNDASKFSRTLRIITDDKEDWTIDLYRCKDCGRYWAREDVGSPWITRSYPFFYFADTDNPEQWLRKQSSNRVLSKLKYAGDPDYDNLIEPLIKI